MDYQIQPCSRKCAITGRELQPGEKYFSALLERDRQFVREDYSVEGWKGPPTGAYSFWTGKVPHPSQPQRPKFDDDALEECFLRLDGNFEPGKLNFRYVVALLLIRRKRYKLDDSFVEDGIEKIRIKHMRTGDLHELVRPHLNDDEILRVQNEVFQVLGWLDPTPAAK